MHAVGSGGDCVVIDDGTSAKQGAVGLHQDHGLPRVLSESGVKLGSSTGQGVVVADATRAGSRSHEIIAGLLDDQTLVGGLDALLLLLVVHLHSLLLLLLVIHLHSLLLVRVGLDTLLLAGTWRLVGTVVEESANDLAVVLSEDGRWPGVNVVGVTAALADNVLAHVTTIGEWHAELLLLLGEHDRGLGDDADSIAELQLSAVQGGGACLGHNLEGLVLLSSVDHLGHVVGAVWDTGWDVVGSLEGGGVGALGGHWALGLGWNVTGSGLGWNVTRSGGRRGNVTRGGHWGRGGSWLVTAADVIAEAPGGLRREEEKIGEERREEVINMCT